MKKVSKKRLKQKVVRGVAHIQTTVNNTIVSITDASGNVIAWSSAGACDFKGARKGTPFAAQTASEKASKEAKDKGIQQVEILVSGAGAGRETAMRAVFKELTVIVIRDVTPLPHNGCRPPKKRRV